MFARTLRTGDYMVIQMVPARALSADIGSYIFGGKDGVITSLGVKMNKNRYGKNAEEKRLFPLSTKWLGQHCHWPEPHAKKMFGFCEVM